MTNEAIMLQRIDALTSAVQFMASALGQRLTRAQLSERMGVHRNTLAKLMKDPTFPLPGKDGKWLLSEIVEWETRK
jgi:predicted DNA-binding transcriptional regulator AlpA